MKSLITAPLLLILSITFLAAQPQIDWNTSWKLKNQYLSALEKGGKSQDAIVADFLQSYTELRDKAQQAVAKDANGKISSEMKQELANHGFSVITLPSSGKDIILENSSFIKTHTLGKLDENVQQFINLYSRDLDQPSRKDHDPKGALISPYEIKKRLTDWHDLSKIMSNSKLGEIIKEKKNYYLELDLDLGVDDLAENAEPKVKKAENKAISLADATPKPTETAPSTNQNARLAPVSQLLSALNTLNADQLAAKQPVKTAEAEIKANAKEAIVITPKNVAEALEKAKGKTTIIVASNARGPHTIALITEHDKKAASGSWGTRMPWGKGFTQKSGTVSNNEDFINNIIGGGTSSWVRTLYILD